MGIAHFLYRVDAAGEPRAELDGSTDHAAWIPVADLGSLPVVELVAWARRAVGR